MEKYEEAAKNFTDHPAIWGIDIGDEPSALDFPYYGQVMDRVNQLFPNQFAYLNVYPNYASVAVNNADQTMNQLGTATYDEHIAKYCEYLPADYLCYDFYLYSCSVTKHYENLCTVANACRNTGRSMWIVLQVNSLYPDQWITENQLRFQAYTAMAFGAENIIWACYTAGWWHNQVVDENGEKTKQYNKLQKINAEIRLLSEDYMHYRRTATHFVGFMGHPDMASVKQEPVEAVSTGIFVNVKSMDQTPLVIGQMVSRYNDGAYALMVCAADDPQDETPKISPITFRVLGERTVTALSGNGKKEVKRLYDGSYLLEIASNEGILIQAK